MDSMTLHNNWNGICSQITTYNDVDHQQFNALASRLIPQAMSDGFLILTVENSFLKNWAERSFSGIIQRALLDIYNIPFTVVIEVDDDQSSTQIKQQIPSSGIATQQVQQPLQQYTQQSNQQAQSNIQSSPQTFTQSQTQISSQQFDIDENINTQTHNSIKKSTEENNPTLPTLTFENFVIGESNRMAYSMAVEVAEVPGNVTLNPLFIYGKSGLGKTHLMRAIQNYINETQPELRTIYVDSEELISGYADAGAQHDKEKSSYKNFKNHYETADVLLIDDIQFLRGKKTLDIVFQIINKMITQGKQIVLSADRAPKNIDLDERYSSRFLQGGTIDIQPPEIETKLAIVKSYINEYHNSTGDNSFAIPENVQMYIAENSSSNIREMKGAVNKVIYHMIFSHMDNISIGEVNTLLENYFSGSMSRNLSVEDIQKTVEDFYKIRHSELIGQSRSRSVMYPRQIAIYLCRQLLDVPFNDIGKKFNRDHSTAMHSVTKVEKLLLENRDVQEEIEALKHLIKEL